MEWAGLVQLCVQPPFGGSTTYGTPIKYISREKAQRLPPPFTLRGPSAGTARAPTLTPKVGEKERARGEGPAFVSGEEYLLDAVVLCRAQS